MALTRKALKAMGLTEEQVDTVAEEHGTQVQALKDQIAALEAKVSDYDAVVKERDELKKGEDYKAKYDKEHGDFEAYKKSVEERDARGAKEAAARAYFEAKGISGKNLDIAMRGSKEEIEALTVKDGAIKDASALDELIGGTFAGLVARTETRSAKMATPPATGGGSTLTKKDIMAIKDGAERLAAIKEHPELF